MKEELISEIISLEWEMFRKVRAAGGRADCQDDYPGFILYRGSQFRAWDPGTLELYLQDLQQARAAGRNLLSEKYAHMMEYTDPEGYEKLRSRLPMPSGEVKMLAGEINEILQRQTEAYAARYPFLSGRGRPVRREEDGPGGTSVETYQLGELYTCSEATLRSLKEEILRKEAAGENYALQVLEYTVKAMGYPGLEAAEAAAGNAC